MGIHSFEARNIYYKQIVEKCDNNLESKLRRVHLSSQNCQVPRGLTARIPGFHPGGPGSTPGVGTVIFFLLLPTTKTWYVQKVFLPIVKKTLNPINYADVIAKDVFLRSTYHRGCHKRQLLLLFFSKIAFFHF